MMSQNPYAIEGPGATGPGDSVQKTLDKWGYTPGKGFASTASQANTGKNTTSANSNDSLKEGTAVTGAEAGSVSSATELRAAQASGESFQDGQNSDKRNPEQTVIATMNFSATARAKGSGVIDNPVGLLFPEISSQPVSSREERLAAHNAQVEARQSLSQEELSSASDALKARNMLGGQHNLQSEHIDDAMRNLARSGEGHEALQNIRQAAQNHAPDPTQVKGTMAQGDTVDMG